MDMTALAFGNLMQWMLVALLAIGAQAPTKADDKNKDALRQKALALNDVTGDDPTEGEIKALVNDATNTKKLLATALVMTKEKEQPFNYTGAFILARAAM